MGNRRILAVAPALALFAAAVCAGSAATRLAPDPRTIATLAEQHGRRCGSFVRVVPLQPFEAREGRCREFGIATFTTGADGTRWYRTRRAEPWFPGDWVVLGDRYAAWTSSEPVARSLADATGGVVRRVGHPAPVARVAPTCDQTFASCRPPRARPTPISPTGYVYSYKRVFWDAGLTDTATGLYIVGSTDPGTGAVTGVVEDDDPRSGHPGPIVGLRITASSADERLPPIKLTTVSDDAGSFAFVNLPAAPEGSCYLVTARAHNLVFLRFATLVGRSVYAWTLDFSIRSSIVESDSERCHV